ncbi:MAG: hypothetical protein ACE5LU_22020 [Anaerolineae bacterium]
MTRFESNEPAGSKEPVEQVARLIHRFDRRQKARLLQLVPELQTIRAEEADIPAEQAELMAYFRRKLEALPERRPMQDDDPFVGGLTVAEFFALSEEEQARIWDEAHAEAERELGSREQPVRPDAVPAR